MVKFLGISKSQTAGKKYDAHFITDSNRKKTVSFGATGYIDFTMPPHSKERQLAYRVRHRGDRITEPMTAGALSWYVLWSATSLREGIQNYKRRFNF